MSTTPRTPSTGGTVDGGWAAPATPERVEFRSDDGLRLQGRWWPASPPSVSDQGPGGPGPGGPGRWSPLPDSVVVLAHGFAASMADSEIEAMADELTRAGCQVLTYDARGHGASEGTCTVGSSEHLDVASAERVAADAAGPAPVVLVGVSMGAVAVVGHLAAAGPPLAAGAVLVSAPSQWRMRVSPMGLLTAGMTRSPVGRWAAARWRNVRVAPDWRLGAPPASSMARIELPVAVVHGEQDRLLSASHGRGLEAAAVGACRLDLVPGMGHGLDATARPRVIEAIGWVLQGGPPAAVDGPDPATTAP